MDTTLALDPSFSQEAQQRFLSKVDRSDDCWEWLGAIAWQGYGAFATNKKMWRAHRYSFAIHNGYLPPDAFICHTCDNRRCVNPAHLYAGDVRTNVRDMMQRGRKNPALGERDGNAKLTTAAVKDIRSSHTDGTTLAELAARHRVSKTCVSNVLTGRTWRHIKGE